MNAYSQSVWFMLRHSIVTLISLVVLTAVFIFLQVAMVMGDLDANRTFQAAIMINLTLATFLGIYLGGALLSLKQNYLWTINQKYRSSIMAAYLTIIGVYCFIQTPFLLLSLDRTELVLLVPFCITVFSSQMVLGKNALLKILLPVTPYLLVQLHRIGTSDAVIVLSILVSTTVLLWVMYHNRLYPDSLSRKRVKQASVTGVVATSAALAPSVSNSFNHFLGVIIAKWVIRSRGDLSWALTMPHTKLALPALFYVLIVMSFVLIDGDNDKQPLEAITILFLFASVINMLMESRFLIRQTRYVAHLFSGPNHHQLKTRILFNLDKTFLTNSLVFIVGVLIAARLFSLPIDIAYLSWSAIAVILTGLASYPALLCLNWINLSFVQVFSVGIYAAMVFVVNLWIRTHPDEPVLSIYPILFVIACVLLRSLTQRLFWYFPFEKLLKNK